MNLKAIEILDDLRYRITCVLDEGKLVFFEIDARKDFGLELNNGLDHMFQINPRAARSILWTVLAFHKARHTEELLKSA